MRYIITFQNVSDNKEREGTGFQNVSDNKERDSTTFQNVSDNKERYSTTFHHGSDNTERERALHFRVFQIKNERFHYISECIR